MKLAWSLFEVGPKFAQSWPKFVQSWPKLRTKLRYKITCPRANNTNYLSALTNAAVFGASLLGVAFTLDTHLSHLLLQVQYRPVCGPSWHSVVWSAYVHYTFPLMYTVYNPNCNHFCPFFQNGVNMKPEMSHPFLWKWNNTIIMIVTYRIFWMVT